MKKIFALMGMAVLLAAAACSSEENEPEVTPPGAEKPAGVVMSKNRVLLTSDFYYDRTADTISFGSDDWRLSYVMFSRDYEAIDGYQTASLVDGDGTSEFSAKCDWLQLDYADKQLIVTALSAYEVDYTDDEDCLLRKQRYAKLLFEHANGVDTLVCSQLSDPWIGGMFPMVPNYLTFPAKGGTLVCQRAANVPTSVKLDDEWFTIYDDDFINELLADGYEKADSANLDFTKGWLSVKRMGRFGRTVAVTVEPNTTGRDRTFSIYFTSWPPMDHYGNSVSGIQYAE